MQGIMAALKVPGVGFVLPVRWAKVQAASHSLIVQGSLVSVGIVVPWVMQLICNIPRNKYPIAKVHAVLGLTTSPVHGRLLL